MKTRVTELLKIEHPIIQGAMAWVSFPPLVAAVSNAGGLGILGSAFMNPEQLQQNVQEIKRLTSKPFGVNFIPESPHLERLLDIVVEEGVPVVSYGIGDPRLIIERSRRHHFIAMPTVGSVKHAVKAEQDGAHAVIVQGMEAGGHSSYVATMVLVPLVADRVRIPVIAAGGIGDSRGLVAALALGAEGISMGTRFIVTQESPVPLNIKRRLLQAGEEDTVVTGHVTGIRCRVLKNKLAEGFLELAERQAPVREMLEFGQGKIRQAFVEGDEDNGSVVCGQICGMITDIPSCQELIQRIIRGAEEILEATRAKIFS
jgi:enoyl-[acyl-carrier protein] reductase II